MNEASLPADLFVELPLPITFGDSAEALVALRNREPKMDAVFCSGDSFAVGALFEAQRRGWRVPEDIAIVGLGDLDLADYVVPALTSARIPGYRMGRIAADMIVRRLQGEILKRRQST
jgi:LacI family gluconate utilization system Gnt-I transcriptional repressor